jgi:hypothetical protein
VSGSLNLAAGASGGGVQWRVFLRALVDEIDSLASAGDRDDMLRGVGVRMAALAPLPAVGTLNTLQIEINDALAVLGWGQASLVLDEPERMLLITHTGLPRIGSAGSPPGTWLAALLEGLYEAWLAQQPDGDSALVARRTASDSADAVTLRYGRA